MRGLTTTRYLTVWTMLACLVLASACENSSHNQDDERPGREENGSTGKAENEPVPVSRHPSVTLELTRYEGELCPPDTVDFSSNPGAFTLHTSTDASGSQRCEIHVQVTVPPGYRFERPVLSTTGYGIREEESAPPTQVAVSYTLGETSVSSHHEVPGAWLEGGDIEDYVLVDTPALTFEACSGTEEPAVLDLQIDIEATVPDATLFRVAALDGELDIGVQWFACPEVSSSKTNGAGFFVDEKHHLPFQ